LKTPEQIKIGLRLWKNLQKRRKYQLFILLISIIFSTFAEAFTIISVVPFLNIIFYSENSDNLYYVDKFSNLFRFQEVIDAKFLITLLFVSLIIIAAFIRLLTIKLRTKLSTALIADFKSEIFKNLLHKEYKNHIEENSADIISGLSSKARRSLITINNILDIISSIFISIGISLGLLKLNWQIFTSSAITFLAIYTFIVFLNDNKLKSSSRIVSSIESSEIKLVNETIGYIRDIILDNLQKFYINEHLKYMKTFAEEEAYNLFTALYPRYIIEAIAIIIITLYAFVSINVFDNSSTEVLIILGAFALGTQRLLPQAQSIYGYWSGITSSIGQLDDFLKLVERKNHKNIFKNISPLNFENKIELKNVSFKYKGTKNYIFQNINLNIYKGDIIGIIGSTGQGKSTLIDILMGLLEPIKGKLLVDQKNIYEKDNLTSWRKSISHVPQDFYVSDNTIKENIALGEPLSEINIQKIKEVIDLTQLTGYLEKLPYGLDTLIGEKGSKLSGGQKQRIAIARSLYKNKQLLILDEATSALDERTERKILKTIKNLSNNLTIILITHRKKSLSICNRILEIENGINEVNSDDIK